MQMSKNLNNDVSMNPPYITVILEMRQSKHLGIH